MAAPPSKPSPSSHPVSSTEAPAEGSATTIAVAKPPPSNLRSATAIDDNSTVVEAAAVAPPPAAALPVTGTIPTYRSSESSRYYTIAKTLLNTGDFEQALATVEEGIEATRAVLSALFASSSSASLTQDAENKGESGDGGNNDYETSISLHESLAPFHYLYGTTLLYSIEESTDGAQAMTMGSGGGEDGAEPEAADDMEIAWENLEAARTILENMMAEGKHHDMDDRLKLDLAQIYLREGDLQRMNGRYDQTVQDYQAALNLRESSNLMGPFDRKIADVHYNLGLTYMLQVAETQQASDPTSTAERPPPPTMGTEASTPPTLTPQQLQEKRTFARCRSFHHYLSCGRTLCGQIALLCGHNDPEELLREASAALPAFKSTGEEDLEEGMDHPKVSSMILESLRKRVAQMTPPEEHADLFQDLNQLLEEIQETIDEAENSEKGVQQVNEMKAEISAAVANQAAAEDAPGGETGAATTSAGFGSTMAEASTAVAQPITTMMVKKKKKKRDEDKGGEGPNKEDPNKRQKAAE